MSSREVPADRIPPCVLARCAGHVELIDQLGEQPSHELSSAIEDGEVFMTVPLDDGERFNVGEACGYLRAVADLTEISIRDLVDCLHAPASTRRQLEKLISICEWSSRAATLGARGADE